MFKAVGIVLLPTILAATVALVKYCFRPFMDGSLREDLNNKSRQRFLELFLATNWIAQIFFIPLDVLNHQKLEDHRLKLVVVGLSWLVILIAFIRCARSDYPLIVHLVGPIYVISLQFAAVAFGSSMEWDYFFPILRVGCFASSILSIPLWWLTESKKGTRLEQ